MTFLMLIVLSISITITVMRFGAAALQDNFVAELSTNYKNSAEFVSFYGLLNFYMYTMAFVYSPSKNALYGKMSCYCQSFHMTANNLRSYYGMTL